MSRHRRQSVRCWLSRELTHVLQESPGCNMHAFCRHFCMQTTCEFTCDLHVISTHSHVNSHALCMLFVCKRIQIASNLHRICNFMFVRLERTTHWDRVRVQILVNNDAFGNTFSLQNTRVCVYFWFSWSSLCHWATVKSASNRAEYNDSCDWRRTLYSVRRWFSDEHHRIWNARWHFHGVP